MNSNKCDMNDNNVNSIISEDVQLYCNGGDDDKETTDLKTNVDKHNNNINTTTLTPFDKITNNKYIRALYPSLSSICVSKRIGKTFAFWFDAQGNPMCIIGPHCNVIIYII